MYRDSFFRTWDYQFLIFLSTVNPHFYRTVHPQPMVTPRDNIEFVMRVAKDFPEHWATKKRKDRRRGNLECYGASVYGPRNALSYYEAIRPTLAYKTDWYRSRRWGLKTGLGPSAASVSDVE
ncbi:hypothetical protein BFJ63_vAg16034 [Fusarium oxysporum f. sp. narcissi]|uniref:Uncharacterized protein n=2 Tax=Fusarium oxysporum TaxID=5507 RepID=A0A8J5NG86_FUSOX|nr:hypothetical protein Forpe1208_v016191 [Fusarium oxysporum f. sp. rapae]RYC81076.1 hypothetical protein BFJ63_vAg16034 [Fusarium oxysporum f. sp. narcissi]